MMVTDTTTTTRRRRATTTPLLGGTSLLLLLLLVCCAAAVTPASGAGDYDPCAGQPSVGKGGGFTVGLAYYPGGAIEDWHTKHPCLYADRVNLTASGVASMVFRPSLDEMAFFRGSPVDETALFASVPGAQVMTVVAYAGNGTSVVRSEPRLVRSSSSSSVMGGAAVGRVNTLTLVARFDKGSLQYLQWHNMGCGDCPAGDACMDVGGGHSACAGTEEACKCSGANCLLDLDTSDSLRCHLTVAAAFSGTDKHSVPLKSAAQIERLGKYSATQAAKGAGASALNNAKALKDAGVNAGRKK